MKTTQLLTLITFSLIMLNSFSLFADNEDDRLTNAVNRLNEQIKKNELAKKEGRLKDLNYIIYANGDHIDDTEWWIYGGFSSIPTKEILEDRLVALETEGIAQFYVFIDVMRVINPIAGMGESYETRKNETNYATVNFSKSLFERANLTERGAVLYISGIFEYRENGALKPRIFYKKNIVLGAQYAAHINEIKQRLIEKKVNFPEVLSQPDSRDAALTQYIDGCEETFRNHKDDAPFDESLPPENLHVKLFLTQNEELLYEAYSGDNSLQYFCIFDQITTDKFMADSAIKLKITQMSDIVYYSPGVDINKELEFNRPDYICKILGVPDYPWLQIRNAWLQQLENINYIKDLNKINNISRGDNAPVFQITDGYSTEVATKVVNYDFSITSIADLHSMSVLINGIPIFGKLGIDLLTTAEKPTIAEQEKFGNRFYNIAKTESDIGEYKPQKIVTGGFELILTPGKNIIQVTSKFNSTGNRTSETKTYEVFCTAEPEQNRKTYYLGISINNYPGLYTDINNNGELSYAVADQEKFLSILMSSIPEDKLVKKVLANSQATKANILSQIELHLAPATIEDNIIIYFCGHGEQTYGTWNMMPNDVDNARNNQLSTDEIYDVFDKLKARNKILLLDACHSGSYVDDYLKKMKKVINLHPEILEIPIGELNQNQTFIKLKEYYESQLSDNQVFTPRVVSDAKIHKFNGTTRYDIDIFSDFMGRQRKGSIYTSTQSIFPNYNSLSEEEKNAIKVAYDNSLTIENSSGVTTVSHDLEYTVGYSPASLDVVLNDVVADNNIDKFIKLATYVNQTKEYVTDQDYILAWKSYCIAYPMVALRPYLSSFPSYSSLTGFTSVGAVMSHEKEYEGSCYRDKDETAAGHGRLSFFIFKALSLEDGIYKCDINRDRVLKISELLNYVKDLSIEEGMQYENNPGYQKVNLFSDYTLFEY